MENTFDQDNKTEITNLLLWKSVKKISDNELELSDGTKLKLRGNEG